MTTTTNRGEVAGHRSTPHMVVGLTHFETLVELNLPDDEDVLTFVKRDIGRYRSIGYYIHIKDGV